MSAFGSNDDSGDLLPEELRMNNGTSGPRVLQNDCGAAGRKCWWKLRIAQGTGWGSLGSPASKEDHGMLLTLGMGRDGEKQEAGRDVWTLTW